MWSSRIVVCVGRREDGADADARAPAARICRHSAGVRACPRAAGAAPCWRCSRAAPSRATSPRCARTYAFEPRSASVRRSRSSPGGSSSPSKSTKRISRAFGGRAPRRRRSRASSITAAVPGGAVVGADEAGRVELRVVVRAEHDRGLAARAGRRRCCAARDGRRRPRSARPAAAGAAARRARAAAASPPGRWPTATCAADRGANARAASKRLTRAAGHRGERRVRPRRASPPSPSRRRRSAGTR